MKIIILILFFCLSYHSKGCEIQIPPKILILSTKIENLDYLKSKNCSQQQLDSFFTLLGNSKGRVSLSHLNDQLHINFISPSPFLELIHLKNLLQSKITNENLRHNYKIIKSPADQAAYFLTDDQYVKVHCYNCDESSSMQLNYNISFQDASHRSHKLNLNLVKSHSFVVFRAIKDIPVFNKNLSPDSFESVTLETEKAENYFDDIKAIRYIRTTRLIKKGEVLLKSHFVYENVIKIGEILTVELNGNGISLQTQGKALQSGGINETIQIKSLKTSKIFSAKITNPGKAEVIL